MVYVAAELKVSGRVLKVGMRQAATERQGGGPRGAVSDWSRASRRRLLMTWGRVRREELAGALELTLTYPGDWRRWAPTGADCKRHLGALEDRWRRRFGKPLWVWKLEFQRRGAPHFMLVTRLPEGVELEELRNWLAESWWRVVGSGDMKHLVAGIEASKARDWEQLGFYMAGYSTRSKEYQHEVPEGFAPGRWWGVSRELLHPWTGQDDAPASAGVRVRRVADRLLESRGIRRPTRARAAGVWVITRSERTIDQVEELLGAPGLLR